MDKYGLLKFSIPSGDSSEYGPRISDQLVALFTATGNTIRDDYVGWNVDEHGNAYIQVEYTTNLTTGTFKVAAGLMIQGVTLPESPTFSYSY